MQIKYSEIRRDYTLDYKFKGETVIVTYSDNEQELTDEFDFSQLEEGDEFQSVETEIPVDIFKSVERIDDELEIVLYKPYDYETAQEVMEKGDEGFPFDRGWQEVDTDG